MDKHSYLLYFTPPELELWPYASHGEYVHVGELRAKLEGLLLALQRTVLVSSTDFSPRSEQGFRHFVSCPNQRYGNANPTV